MACIKFVIVTAAPMRRLSVSSWIWRRSFAWLTKATGPRSCIFLVTHSPTSVPPPTRVASGLLAVVFSSASLVNVLMIAGLGRARPRLAHLLAAAVGLSGVVCLFWPELQVSDAAMTSLGLCLIGTLFFLAQTLSILALPQEPAR